MTSTGLGGRRVLDLESGHAVGAVELGHGERPDDLEGHIKRFQSVEKSYPGTDWGSKAKSRREQAELQIKNRAEQKKVEEARKLAEASAKEQRKELDKAMK